MAVEISLHSDIAGLGGGMIGSGLTNLDGRAVTVHCLTVVLTCFFTAFDCSLRPVQFSFMSGGGVLPDSESKSKCTPAEVGASEKFRHK